LRIRDSMPEDARGVAALLTELGYPANPEPIRGRLRAFDGDPRSFVLVAEDAGRLLGFASGSALRLLHEDGSWCRLSALVVARASRRSGIGRDLVAEVEARARALGCRYLEVTSGETPGRRAAHDFYEAIGLAQVSRRYLKEL
jgi:GNAT superfamily N-acetyltransferase